MSREERYRSEDGEEMSIASNVDGSITIIAQPGGLWRRYWPVTGDGSHTSPTGRLRILPMQELALRNVQRSHEIARLLDEVVAVRPGATVIVIDSLQRELEPEPIDYTFAEIRTLAESFIPMRRTIVPPEPWRCDGDRGPPMPPEVRRKLERRRAKDKRRGRR